MEMFAQSLVTWGGYEIFKPSDRCDARVRMYTLGSLIREFGVRGSALLKMSSH